MADLPGYISDTELYYDVSDDAPVDGSSVCSCNGVEPGVPPTGGGTGSGATPVQTPSIGTVIGCIGGGLVPTQADLSFAEVWWGFA